MMLESERYLITKMHISKFELAGERINPNFLNSPLRICVLDRQKEIAIDVETFCSYPYVKILNMQYLFGFDKISKYGLDKRYACVEHHSMVLGNVDLEILKRCKKVIMLLEQNFIFPDGNDELTNEEYLNITNDSKSSKKLRKAIQKRK